MLQNLSMDLLRTFLRVIDTHSFTRTAELIGRTQSAVTLQIQRLEEHVNAALFVRDARNLKLTPQGEMLAEYAQRILALNDEAVAAMRGLTVAGRVRLGAPHEYTASLLPDFLGKFAQSQPNVMLEVTSDLSKNLLERQQNGEFDLIIALHSDDGGSAGGKRIFVEPLVWISSLDHACEAQNPVPLVLAPAPCIYRYRMLQTLKAQERPCRISYLSSSYNAIMAAVRAGLGVTAVARSTVPSYARLISEHQGLPALGQVDVRLHRINNSPDDGAIAYLEQYIADSFANVGLRPRDPSTRMAFGQGLIQD
ncbi:MAG: LysR substrate-binding domain-containing protein [Pseudomonadota bacterium]